MIEIVHADSPVLLGLPHTGTDVPSDVMTHLNGTGRALADTDWHIHRLYDDLLTGVGTIRTPMHRYVIDVNRDPGGASLYPGQNTTGLCPTTDFDGSPIYLEGQEPDAAEIERRRQIYHAPYHAAIKTEMARIKARFGFAVLYDCHSIRSHIPFLFEGTLPDFNIGTNMGTTCAKGIEARTFDHCANAQSYSHILNGRFKGGWTTRHYGRPTEGMHALQMELAQSTYLTNEHVPWTYDTAKAARLRLTLNSILGSLQNWTPE